MVALVGSSEAEEEAFTRLTHPKPVVALQRKEAFPVLLRNRNDQEEAQDTSQDQDARPASSARTLLPEPELTPQPVVESGPEPVGDAPRERRTDILPCSVCKKTLREPKHPYNAPQRAARR